MKVLSVIGARPQFVKAIMVSRALKEVRGVTERILHTGQHYDTNMSDLFFKQLKLSKPYKNLNAGSGSHGSQTAQMLIGIEKECLREKPDCVLIYGDTNSTIAAALAASKLHIPVAHVESGLRSFNWEMPEEINRIVSDRLSQLLFVPTQHAVDNLRNEGITKGVHRVGDVMIDALYFFRERALKLPRSYIHSIVPDHPYFVLTLHRAENIDNPRRLRSIFKGLAVSKVPFVFPIHPRAWAMMKKSNFSLPDSILSRKPVGYFEMILLQLSSQAVWTDSGGVQKEAVVLGKNCYTLRDQTEWVETVASGWNQLLGADSGLIRRALREKRYLEKRKRFPVERYYGTGKSAERIATILRRSFG